MSSPNGIVIVNNVKLPINASFEEAFSVAKARLKKIGIKKDISEFYIYRRSVDARKRDNILFVYSVATRVSSVYDEERLRSVDAAQSFIEEPFVNIGFEPMFSPPVVVGTGPAGLFAALLLAENGYAPVVLERGGRVEARRTAIEKLKRLRILDPETNIQFGAGGAGTFSDGKLVTRINDPLVGYVLRRFVEFGAPEEIEYIAKPHIGTDILSVVVENMLDHICKLGGRVLFNTRYESPNVKDGRVVSVNTTAGEIAAGALILAIGHSARDTYEKMIDAGFDIAAKDFSVGMRIEHKTVDIDSAMYGKFAGNEALGHAEYTLSHNTKERGVYSFCMCPGGEVVAAASEEGGLVVNGMSENARANENSNSAIVASVFRSDYGATPKAAIEFQRKIERDAFSAGGGDYTAPIITLGDFLSDKLQNEPKRILPSYMGGAVRLASPSEYLPSFVIKAIKGAFSTFERRINGFSVADAVLTGAETRTSAPLRIMRDNTTRLATGYKNLYPAGEGAGYAGGITSASVDGIKTALSLMSIYSPLKI